MILTIGDGIEETQSDAGTAFENVKEDAWRNGNGAGSGSYFMHRTVSFQTLEKELSAAGFEIVDQGMTHIGAGFSDDYVRGCEQAVRHWLIFKLLFGRVRGRGNTLLC